MRTDQAHLPRGTLAAPPWSLELTPQRAGWSYAGLRVLELSEGGELCFDTGEEEMLILPLAGSATITCDTQRFTLHGRTSVFASVSDFLYLPRDATVTIRGTGRLALPFARADRRLTPRYGAARDVPVELRGAGQASRQVNNFCAPETFDCDRLIAVEVLTPGGNWSSYPPHKHDENLRSADGVIEAALEEIYYFETSAPHGFAYQQVYAVTGRPLDVLAQVRTGDVVLVPYGYHGPSMAPPGYDLYFLNVLAGAAARTMACRDDPQHAWIRGSWAGKPTDPRLPLTTAETGGARCPD